MKRDNRFLTAFNNFKLCKKWPIWISIPCIVLLIAFIVILSLSLVNHSAARGFNIGIDFEGGTILTVTFGEEAHSGNKNYNTHVNDIKKIIREEGLSVSYVQTASGNKTEDDAIQFRYSNNSSDADKIFGTNDMIVEKIKAKYPTLLPSQIKAETIGKTAANDLLEKAGIALAVSILLILIYIIIRFEFVAGVAAVITTVHDAIIMFLLTVIFRIQINSSYVAAAITIISYSINNVIIIFDRCREIIKPMKGASNINYEEIGDGAVKVTLTRSLYTTFTTLITVSMLAIFGGVTMREFVVPIIIGLFVGLYSSIFMATPIWARLSYVFDKLRLKRYNRKLAKEGKVPVDSLPNKVKVPKDLQKNNKDSKNVKNDKFDANVETTEIQQKPKKNKNKKQNTWVNPKKAKSKKDE